MDTIKTSRKLRWIPRFSTVPLVRPQSVAEHSHGVAVIALEICKILKTQTPEIEIDVAKVLEFSIHHDTPEGVTGDILYQNKRADKHLGLAIENLEKNLEKEVVGRIGNRERSIVYLADMMELNLYVKEEQELGNRSSDLEAARLLSSIHCISRLEHMELGKTYFRKVNFPNLIDLFRDAREFLSKKFHVRIPDTSPTVCSVYSKTLIDRQEKSSIDYSHVLNFEKERYGYLWGAVFFEGGKYHWFYAQVNELSETKYKYDVLDLKL